MSDDETIQPVSAPQIESKPEVNQKAPEPQVKAPEPPPKPKTPEAPREKVNTAEIDSARDEYKDDKAQGANITPQNAVRPDNSVTPSKKDQKDVAEKLKELNNGEPPSEVTPKGLEGKEKSGDSKEKTHTPEDMERAKQARQDFLKFRDEYRSKGDNFKKKPEEVRKAYEESKGMDPKKLNKDNFNDFVKARVESETGKPATKEQIEKETGKMCERGESPEAVAQHTQNIMDKTQKPFTDRFKEDYKAKNGGKEPSEEEVQKAYAQEFLRAFSAFGPYGSDGKGWGATVHGIDPDKIDPAFQTEDVKKMMNQYPNVMESQKYPDGTTEKASFPHMLNRLELAAGKPEADPKASNFERQYMAPWASGSAAEMLKISDPKSMEPGTTGSIAGASPKLVQDFIKSPVDAMRSFASDPRQYLLDVANREYAANNQNGSARDPNPLPPSLSKYKMMGGSGHFVMDPVTRQWRTANPGEKPFI